MSNYQNFGQQDEMANSVEQYSLDGARSVITKLYQQAKQSRNEDLISAIRGYWDSSFDSEVNISAMMANLKEFIDLYGVLRWPAYDSSEHTAVSGSDHPQVSPSGESTVMADVTAMRSASADATQIATGYVFPPEQQNHYLAADPKQTASFFPEEPLEQTRIGRPKVTQPRETQRGKLQFVDPRSLLGEEVAAAMVVPEEGAAENWVAAFDTGEPSPQSPRTTAAYVEEAVDATKIGIAPTRRQFHTMDAGQESNSQPLPLEDQDFFGTKVGKQRSMDSQAPVDYAASYGEATGKINIQNPVSAASLVPQSLSDLFGDDEGTDPRIERVPIYDTARELGGPTERVSSAQEQVSPQLYQQWMGYGFGAAIKHFRSNVGGQVPLHEFVQHHSSLRGAYKTGIGLAQRFEANRRTYPELRFGVENGELHIDVSAIQNGLVLEGLWERLNFSELPFTKVNLKGGMIIKDSDYLQSLASESLEAEYLAIDHCERLQLPKAVNIRHLRLSGVNIEQLLAAVEGSYIGELTLTNMEEIVLTTEMVAKWEKLKISKLNLENCSFNWSATEDASVAASRFKNSRTLKLGYVSGTNEMLVRGMLGKHESVVMGTLSVFDDPEVLRQMGIEIEHEKGVNLTPVIEKPLKPRFIPDFIWKILPGFLKNI